MISRGLVTYASRNLIELKKWKSIGVALIQMPSQEKEPKKQLFRLTQKKHRRLKVPMRCYLQVVYTVLRQLYWGLIPMVDRVLMLRILRRVLIYGGIALVALVIIYYMVLPLVYES